MSDFSSRLKYYRKRDGLTQEEVAKRLGLRKSTICNYENDYSEPNMENLQKIAELFHVTLDEIIGITPTVHEPGLMPLATALPVLSLSSAEPTGEEISLPSSFLKSGDYFAVCLPDDELQPVHLCRGDFVICDRHAVLKNGDLVAFFSKELGVIVRCYYAEGTQLTLTSLGKKPPLLRKTEDIITLGKVIKAAVSF